MVATHTIDHVSGSTIVVSIAGLAQNEWSQLIDTEGAVSVFMSVNGADVSAYLPLYDTSTDEWITDGTDARKLEFPVAGSHAGAIKEADGSTYVGVIPGNVMPPKIQYQNTNAFGRIVVTYITYPPGHKPAET